MALTTPCSVTLYQRSVEWWFTQRRSFCPWQSKRRACGAGCWRRNIRCPNICPSHCLSFCPSALPLIFFSSVRPSEHQCINLSSVIFHVAHSLCCCFVVVFVGGWGRGECLTKLSSIQSSIFIIFFIHPLIYLFDFHSAIHWFTHLFSPPSHPLVCHIMHPLLCIFLSCFSFLHALTYSICPVIHWSVTLCIHCCVSSCPVSPFFTHSPIQSVQSSTGLSHYASIVVYLPVLFLLSSRTHLFNLSSHPLVTLCIHCCVSSCPVSPFFTHSPIQSVQSSTGTLCIHCCVSSCPISPFFTPSPIQSVQSSTGLSHYASIVVYLPVLFLLSSCTHLFNLSSHPLVCHIMHPLLCIFLSCFSFLHALTYSICPVIHWSVTLCIHCCVSSCPVSPFFTHSPIQSVQSSTGLSHYASIVVYLPVLFLLSSRTHLFNLSSHPLVCHIMHPLLCIFLSYFSILHSRLWYW